MDGGVIVVPSRLLTSRASKRNRYLPLMVLRTVHLSPALSGVVHVDF